MLSPHFTYGDERGGHVRVFFRPHCFEAYYYGGAGFGICLGIYGQGATPSEAVRNLWGKL